MQDRRKAGQCAVPAEKREMARRRSAGTCDETNVRTAGTYTPQAATAEMKEEKGQKEEDTRRKEEQTRSKPGE